MSCNAGKNLCKKNEARFRCRKCETMSPKKKKLCKPKRI